MSRLRASHAAHVWVAHRVPSWALYRPEGAWFGLACLLTGPAALAGIARPGSLEATLPDWVVRVWGGALLAGGLALLVGLVSITRQDDVLVLGRPAVYKLGLRVLMWTTGLFTVSIWIAAGWRGFTASLLIAAFSLTMFLRLNQVVTSEAVQVIQSSPRKAPPP